MLTIEKHVCVHAPRGVTYDCWTRFEGFPTFMTGVEDVRRVDASHLCWRARDRSKIVEWDAEITELVAERRVAWHAVNGPRNAAVVTFHGLAEHDTRVIVRVDLETRGARATLAAWLGITERRVAADLARFKALAEARSVAIARTLRAHPPSMRRLKLVPGTGARADAYASAARDRGVRVWF